MGLSSALLAADVTEGSSGLRRSSAGWIGFLWQGILPLSTQREIKDVNGQRVGRPSVMVPGKVEGGSADV